MNRRYSPAASNIGITPWISSDSPCNPQFQPRQNPSISPGRIKDCKWFFRIMKTMVFTCSISIIVFSSIYSYVLVRMVFEYTFDPDLSIPTTVKVRLDSRLFNYQANIHETIKTGLLVQYSASHNLNISSIWESISLITLYIVIFSKHFIWL